MIVNVLVNLFKELVTVFSSPAFDLSSGVLDEILMMVLVKRDPFEVRLKDESDDDEVVVKFEYESVVLLVGCTA